MRPRKSDPPKVSDLDYSSKMGVYLEPRGSHDTDPFEAALMNGDTLQIKGELTEDGNIIVLGSHYTQIVATGTSEVFVSNLGNSWTYSEPEQIICLFCATPALPEKERIRIQGAEYGLCIACGGNLPVKNREMIQPGKVRAEYTTVSSPELVATLERDAVIRRMLTVLILVSVIMFIIWSSMVR